MARLITCGFEAQLQDSGTGGDDDWEGTDSTTISNSTATKRSGDVSLECSGAGVTTAKTRWIFNAFSLGTTVYIRAYYQFSHLPDSDTVILIVGNSGSHVYSAMITTGGKFQLWRNDEAAQVGSDSSATVTAGDGLWYRLEMEVTVDTGAGEAAELRVDGTTVASESGQNFTDTQIDRFGLGWDTDPGTGPKILFVDDVAINDDAGSNQNSWPGEGKIVQLNPVSDNSIGNWTAGAGGTTNLFEAVNNEPPTGNASPADTDQITNANSGGIPNNCDFNCRSYSNAGIASGDTIALVHAVCNHAELQSQQTKNGELLIVSNPVQSAADTFQFGGDAGAAGTWPTNWLTTWGTPQYSPSVTLATEPVLRITKDSATTRGTECDFMAIQVEYTEGADEAGAPFMLLGVGK